MSHSPPQWHRAVHFNAAFLHLHRPVQVFLHPQQSNSLDATLDSGSMVHNGFSPMVWINPSPVTRGWHVQTNLEHLAPAVPTLINSSFNVLHKSCFSWRNSIHCSSLLCEQFFASFINVINGASTIIKQDSEPVQLHCHLLY